MSNIFERRKCQRFQIPGAESKYKKIGLLSLLNNFTSASLQDISKGGLCFLCGDDLKKGQRLKVQLSVPDEQPISLYSRVCRIGQQWLDNTFNRVSVEFMPFGSKKGCNPVETLEFLRKLDRHYCSI